MKNNVLAFLSGIISGLFGTGGGVIALPFLENILNDKRKAHQAISFFILPLTVFSCVIKPETVGGCALIHLCIGALLGGGLGGYFANKVKVKYIRLLFAAVIICVGVKSFI